MHRLSQCSLVLALIGCSAGCAKTLNSSIVAFDEGAGSEVVGGDATPSLTNGHARNHWPRVTVDVPEKTVEVEPDYVDDFVLAKHTARQKGWYPTVDTVFDEDRDHGTAAFEALLAGPHAIGSVILIPFEMVFCQRWPGEVETAPTNEYQRIMPPPQTADAMIMEADGE